MKVCGIGLSVVEWSTEAKLRAQTGRMGSGTLAWSTLPGGGCSHRIQQEYNRAVTWDWRKAWEVMFHELGHGLGLGHGPNGNLMQPFYSGALAEPGPWDISQGVKRYDEPADVPPPPPPPPPPGVDPRGAYGILTWYHKNRKPTGFTEEVHHRATAPTGGK
jgi:hypothetical protein